MGGFAATAKRLGITLLREGFEVVIAVPGKKEQKQTKTGFTLLRLSKKEIFCKETYRKINADIYHSQNNNALSTMAVLSEPKKKHIIACSDPRDLKDWLIEFKYATWLRRLKTPISYLFEEGPLVSWGIRHATVPVVPAFFLKKKVKCMYGVHSMFLPYIEPMPKRIPRKAKKPTVCFIARLDRRKRPELCLKLAQKFPHVDFLIVGVSEEDKRQKELEAMAQKTKNVKMLGLIDKFNSNKLNEVYNRSWILINTAAREGLPNTFVEAAGRGCAILSYVNPDEFASRFGFWAKNLDFEKGLNYLLEKNRWKTKGKAGYAYVSSLYEEKKSIKTHVKLYKKLLNNRFSTV